MSRVTDKFMKLKKAVGGNREKSAFEWTTGHTVEEKANITGLNKANRRILAELEYLMHLSEERENAYGDLLEQALDLLLEYKKDSCHVYDSAKMTLEQVTEVMRQAEKDGLTTVRLHTGDPCIYGATREQMDILEREGIRYDSTPGVSAFCGAASALCGAMVCGLADYLWNYPRVMCIFWFVFAMALAGTKVCVAGKSDR